MNILICAGEKTINIVNALRNRFASGAVEIIKEDRVQDIEKVLGRGDYFDRAIILEPAWTDNGRVQDKEQISMEVAKICKLFEQRCGKNTLFFFVANSKEMAQTVYDESLDIHSNTIILVKEPSYSVLFFADLITGDAKSIYPTLRFSPEDEVSESQQNNEDQLWSAEKPIVESLGFGEDLEKVKDISIDPNSIIDRNDGEDKDIYTDDVEQPEEIYNEVIEDYEDAGDNQEIYDDTDDEVSWMDLDGDEDRGDDSVKSEESRNEMDHIEDNKIEAVEGILKESEKDYKGECEESDDSSGLSDRKLLGGFVNKKGSTYRRRERKVKIKQNAVRIKDDTRSEEENIRDIDIAISNVKNILEYYRNRGGSIIITGAEGCGKSTIAANLANTINRLGYSVLLVDFDTKGRSQAYINKDAYESVNFYNRQKLSLMQALGSSTGIARYANIIRPGMHILTNSLAEEVVEYADIAESYRMTRLDVSARGNYDMTVYDMPFDIATDYGSTILNTCDNLVVIVDKSTWGAVKFILNMSNIENEDIQDEVFSRAKICFNKSRGKVPIFGSNTYKNNKDILIRMDGMVKELIGVSIDLRFEDMELVSEMPFDHSYENYWIASRFYSDEDTGFMRYIGLLDSIFGIGKSGR